MLNFLNPSDKTDSELQEIINNMGTFYNMFDYQSKERLKSYFNALLVGLEGLYYNVSESSECHDLNGSLPYLDLSYNEIELDSKYAEIEKVSIPVLEDPSIIGASGSEDYSYAVTAVDLNGVETPISEIKVVHNAADILNNTDKVKVSWAASGGAVSYNVYGRTVGNLNKIGSTTSLIFFDEGQGLTAVTPPVTNDTLWYYLMDIPLDYYFFNITSLGDLNQDVDYTIYNFRKIKITNVTAFKNTHKKYILKGAYAFLPILLSLYLKALTNSDNYLKILYDYAYTGYLDSDHIGGTVLSEKINKGWAFHLNKLLHNISLLTRRSLNITNLEKILSLIYNVPFAYDSGTLENISYSGGYTTFTIGGYYYKIPDTLSLLKNNGQSISKYEILISGVTIKDAYSESSPVTPTDDFDANRLISISIPGTILNIGKHSLLVDSFYNNILPKNLEII